MSDEKLQAALKDLKKTAVFDHRHPITYEDSIPEAVAVATRYFAALARRDLDGIAEKLHFPHAAIEGSEVVIIESAEALKENPPPSMDVSQLDGLFDVLDGVQTYTSDAVSAGVTLSYTRYRADGKKMSVCDGVYVVTNNNGRWALEVTSTIFTPADQVGVVYEETIASVLKRGRDWMEGWSLNDGKLLDSTRKLLGTSVGLYPPVGRRMRGAREGNLDYVFRSDGIDTRLRVSETTELADGYYNYEWFNDNAGHGVGSYAYTLYLPDAQVLHQSNNKAHVHGGYIRYQADGSIISITHTLGVHVKRNFEWGSAGGSGAVIHYDATNDDRG